MAMETVTSQGRSRGTERGQEQIARRVLSLRGVPKSNAILYNYVVNTPTLIMRNIS